MHSLSWYRPGKTSDPIRPWWHCSTHGVIHLCRVSIHLIGMLRVLHLWRLSLGLGRLLFTIYSSCWRRRPLSTRRGICARRMIRLIRLMLRMWGRHSLHARPKVDRIERLREAHLIGMLLCRVRNLGHLWGIGRHG